MPNRIIREGILTSEIVSILPKASGLRTLSEIERVRSWLPRVRAGHPLQAYKWALSSRARYLREHALGGIRRSRSTDLRLLNAADDTCVICGTQMCEWVTGRFKTIDHVVPLSKGGDNSASNLRVICNVCNSRRGNRADPSNS